MTINTSTNPAAVLTVTVDLQPLIDAIDRLRADIFAATKTPLAQPTRGAVPLCTVMSDDDRIDARFDDDESQDPAFDRLQDYVAALLKAYPIKEPTCEDSTTLLMGAGYSYQAIMNMTHEEIRRAVFAEKAPG